MTRLKVLFVDDDPKILDSMTTILEMHGYEVTAVGNFMDALREITKNKFGLLLTDLHLGQQSDGFILASVMKRLHPETATFMQTGYPAFMQALSDIRCRVDDYSLKPEQTFSMLNRLRNLLKEKPVRKKVPVKRVSQVLKEEKSEILERFYDMCLANEFLGSQKVSRKEVLEIAGPALDCVIRAVKSPSTFQMDPANAIHRGVSRKKQGYTVPMLVEETRLFADSIFFVLQDRLQDLDLSQIAMDFAKISNYLLDRTRIAIEAYVSRKDSK